MKSFTIQSLRLACIATLFSPLSAFATNGLFQHGYGIRINAMAGAGVALPQDALISATNPAGNAFLDERKDIGISFFNPERNYRVTGASSGGFPPFEGDQVDSGNTLFPVPHFGWNKHLDSKSAFGISVYANGGLNTKWDASDTPTVNTPNGPANGTFLDGEAGVDNSQLFINFSYSRKISTSSAVGISGIVNYSEFEATGLNSFQSFSTSPQNLSDNGKSSDVGFGLKIGGIFSLSPTVDFGLSYQSEIKNTLDEYAGLFAEGGELNVPPTATIGFAFKPNAKSAIAFDIQQIYFSQVSAIGNEGTGNPTGGLYACAAGDQSRCLGGSNGAGFGWEDITVFKLGYQIHTNNDTTWRFGISSTEQPIPENEVTLNILAPGVTETHFTAGYSRTLSSGNIFSASLMYAPEVCVSGPSAFNPGQTVELCMDQVQLGIGYAW